VSNNIAYDQPYGSGIELQATELNKESKCNNRLDVFAI